MNRVVNVQDEDNWVEYKVLLLHVANEEGRRKVVSEEQVVEQTEVVVQVNKSW